MTRIMQFCIVLVVVVSAFFYAPMEVSAEESLSMLSHQFVTTPKNSSYEGDLLGYMDWSNGMELMDDVLYKVNVTFNLSLTSDFDFRAHGFNLSLQTSKGFFPFFMIDSTDNVGFNQYYTKNYSMSYTGEYYYVGRILKNMMTVCHGTFVTPSEVVFNYNADLDYTVNSIVPISEADAEDYQNGYNAGYSAGEQAGYGNGYSQGFTDGEASVDTDAIYDEAFQAGKDSVDTQSYYDAGYQAGYQVAYSEGYESGYDVGYQSAMDRIANWGADISEYPLEISSGNSNSYFSVHVGSDIPFNYRDSDHWFSSNDYNPNHTYKYVINFSNIDEGLDSDILYDYWDIYLNIGGIEYNITPFRDMSVSVFIPGDRISTSYSFDWVLYNCANYVADDSNLAYLYVDYDFVIYDMGPSGDTQNHIANQTDQLTNGYDSSQGAAVNDDFKASVNEYHTAEDSLFSTATTSLENFTFLDFTSITGMVTSLSFVTSIMTSIYMAMGGDTGASGIILAVLFSVMLVSMAIGLYRYYVSNGKSDGSGKGGD